MYTIGPINYGPRNNILVQVGKKNIPGIGFLSIHIYCKYTVGPAYYAPRAIDDFITSDSRQPVVTGVAVPSPPRFVSSHTLLYWPLLFSRPLFFVARIEGRIAFSTLPFPPRHIHATQCTPEREKMCFDTSPLASKGEHA